MKSLIYSISMRTVYAIGIVIFGAATGLLVKWLSSPWIIQDWLATESPFWPPDFKHEVWMGMLYGAIYASGLWGTILGVRRLAYRYIPLRSIWSVAAHMSLISVAVVCVFTALKYLDPYICILVRGEPPPDDLPTGIITVVSMGASLIISMILYSVDFYRDMRRAKRTALVAELRALRAQINPHFLFNTLNSIAALVHRNPDEAERVVEELGDLFRYTLRASQYPTVSLEEELTATNRYLAIEKARFCDRMTVIQEIDNSILDARMPSLLIQPLVENAVKHGVSKTEGNCAISVKISKEQGNIVLSVRDTGPGFVTTDPREIFPRGTGLANVRDRLQLHFNELASFHILPDGIEITFPYRSESGKSTELVIDSSANQR